MGGGLGANSPIQGQSMMDLISKPKKLVEENSFWIANYQNSIAQIAQHPQNLDVIRIRKIYSRSQQKLNAELPRLRYYQIRQNQHAKWICGYPSLESEWT